MQLEALNERNVRYSRDDGGSIVNTGDDFVLVSEPSTEELSALFDEFERDLKSRILELMCMPYSEVIQNFGQLDLKAAIPSREDIPFGTLTRRGSKLVNLTKGCVVRGLVRIGELSEYRPNGLPRTRFPNGAGNGADYLMNLSSGRQAEMLKSLIERDDIDDYFNFTQTCRGGLETLSGRIKSLQNGRGDDFLGDLARTIHRSMEGIFAKGDDQSSAKGSGYTYADMWFGIFLAAKGIWLFPMSVFSSVRTTLVPNRLLPLVAWLSVPSEMKDIADAVLRFSTEDKTHIKFVLNAFVTVSLTSDMWSSRRFCAHPMLQLKEWIVSRPSSAHRSVAINELYKLIAKHLSVNLSLRTDAPVFLRARRINAREGDFSWTRHPSKKTLEPIEKLIGRPVTDVPAAVTRWADLLRENLPLFAVKDPRRIVYLLTPWLAYLMTLPESEIPIDLRYVDYHRHGVPFAAFLSSNYDDTARRADLISLSKMEFLWDRIATRENFIGASVNPFSVPMDKGTPIHVDASGREAMMPQVAAFLSEFNHRDNFAYARSRSDAWKRQLNFQTGHYDTVFWGLEARCIDLCLNYGIRLIDARWLESGEGDEYYVDLETLEPVDNSLSSASRGRQQGPIRKFWYQGETPHWALGLYRMHDKSGLPKFLPHMEKRIATWIRELADLQTSYNPVVEPVAFIDPTRRHAAAAKDKILHGYPLMRDPDDVLLFSAVSEYKVRSYWADLCRDAQEALNRHLGYDHPLFIDGKIRFQIHDLRVTNATELAELGFSLRDIADYLGHVSETTARRYVAKKLERVHRAKEEANQVRTRSLTEAPKPVLLEAVEHPYVPAHIHDYVGLDVGKKLLSSGRMHALSKFDHGLCPGADCSKGGPLKGGKPTPTWRPRACGACRFRMTGPRFKDGIAANINRLSWEIFQSIRREKEFNQRLDECGPKDEGRRTLSNTAKAEAAHRANLLWELGAEYKTHQGILMMIKELQAQGVAQENLLVPSSSEFNAAETSFAFVEGTEFELLWEIVGRPHVLHPTTLDVPHDMRVAWKEMNRFMMRAAGLADVAIKIPAKQEDAVIREFAGAVIENLDTPEIAKLMQGKYEAASFPNLGRAINELAAKVLLLGAGQ
ncbi:site-specific integrase [Rhizobium leguminosarum]|nr:site-specific integrase [Rhizobium leguminosarum]